MMRMINATTARPIRVFRFMSIWPSHQAVTQLWFGPAKKLRQGAVDTPSGRSGRRLELAQTLLLESVMDPREQRQVKLGIGDYQARQVGDKIVLHASGETPTPSYKVWLRAASDPGPAIYELWWREPADATLELPTPFSADVSFRAPPNTKTVRVRDAAGVHEVPVEAVSRPTAPATKALVYLH